MRWLSQNRCEGATSQMCLCGSHSRGCTAAAGSNALSGVTPAHAYSRRQVRTRCTQVAATQRQARGQRKNAAEMASLSKAQLASGSKGRGCRQQCQGTSSLCCSHLTSMQLRQACCADLLAAASDQAGPAAQSVRGRAARPLRACCPGGLLGAPSQALQSESKMQISGDTASHPWLLMCLGMLPRLLQAADGRLVIDLVICLSAALLSSLISSLPHEEQCIAVEVPQPLCR